MPHLGFPELLLILGIVVILFGVNKLPRLGKGLGEGIRNFKDSLSGGASENESAPDDANAPRSSDQKS